MSETENFFDFIEGEKVISLTTFYKSVKGGNHPGQICNQLRQNVYEHQKGLLQGQAYQNQSLSNNCPLYHAWKT
ncbi:MAG: hypothetical protein ACTSW1_11340 [Candidatus Hodarchaeales archaeon]